MNEVSKSKAAKRPKRRGGKSGSVKRRAAAGDEKPPLRFPIAGIGASAGGLEAFTELLKHLPPDTGMGFVLVSHLDPQHESALTQILARSSSMPVREAGNNLRVEANHVYIIPPNTILTIVGGMLKLGPRREGRRPARSIDTFFESLAQDQSERAIGVILSGTATDGTLGLEMIKAEGGITFAQDASAKYDSMPKSAVAAGCVDFVLKPGDIAKELGRIAKHPYVAGQPPEHVSPEEGRASATAHKEDETALPSGGRGRPPKEAKRARSEAKAADDEPGDKGFKETLLLLHKHSGVDFSLYKSTTIQRRITRRLVLNKQVHLEDYGNLLRGNAKELDALYSDVLISVTNFFRNPEAFEVLQHKVFPNLLKRRGDDPFRVWVLGCSTGQEAYSIAMAFVESAEKAPRLPKLQVFATDLNDALLDKARNGLYAKSLAQDVSPERLRRFFVEEEGGYRVVKQLREMVVFARQNLISDPPFSRMDLVSCRNLLIYLEPALQQKAIPTFHYALKPDGFLLLGASESIGGFTDLFEPVDKKQKVYSKKSATTSSLHLPVKGERGQHPPLNKPRQAGLPLPRGAGPEDYRTELNAQREADRVTVNQFAPPGVLINADLQVLQFRGPTSAYLEPPKGKASFDVLKMAREGLMLPLRTAIKKAKKENSVVRRENLRVRQNGGTRAVNIEVIPLKNLRERCYLILFEQAKEHNLQDAAASDVEQAQRPSETRTRQELKQPKGRTPKDSRLISELERELAETRDYLQSIQEQHEAANEEVQASNEEVTSANEELQSVNEELETSKEELESANEELTTVNEEMANRNTELSRLNSDLSNLQSSTRLAILLLGRDLTIRRFSTQAEKQFNLLAADIGRPLANIRHNLDVPDLESVAAEVIASVHEWHGEVQDRDGRWYGMRVRPYLTLDNKVDGAVLVLVDIHDLKRSEQEAKAARDYAEATIHSTRDPLLVLRGDLRVNTVNDAFYKTFQTTPDQTEGRLIYEVGKRQWDIPELRTLLEETLPRDNFFNDFEVTHDFSHLGRRTMLLSARRLVQEPGTSQMILLSIQDITERKRAEEARARLAAIVESSDDAIIGKDLSGIITSWNQGAEHLFGYTAQEAIGQPIMMLIPSDHRAEESAIQQRIRHGESIGHFETVRRRKDGMLCDISLTVSPIVDTQGKVIGASIIARDITERKRLEESLKERADELARAHRRKDEFLAMLAHELRNPLAPMLNATELLRGDDVSAEESAWALGVMGRQIANMTRMIDDLLDVSRITQGKIALRKKPVPLEAILTAAANIVRSGCSTRGQELALTLPVEPLFLNADATRLEQVFGNLLANASKYGGDGCHIAVSAELAGGEVVVRVTDDGAGIAPELLPHVFDLFVQSSRASDRKHGGLGIGLTIVQRLVQLHGGSVEARSEGPGHGAEFIVRLPILAEAPAAAFLPDEPTASEIPRRILIVDDNTDSARSLALLQTRGGHEARTAFTGAEALVVAAEFVPEVVMLDIGLPGMDGFELARHIRAMPALKGAFLIAMTGYGSPEDRAEAQRVGFDKFLVKPIDLNLLNEWLRQRF